MTRKLRHTVRFAVLALGLVWLGAVALAAAQAPELRTAAAVRQLTAAEAEKGLPVRLRGVITYIDEKTPSKSFRFIQDDTAGIYFQPEFAQPPPALATGQLVEMRGRTGKGEFAPVIFAQSVEILGTAPYPTARPTTLEQLLTGQEDSQYVEVGGVVRSVRLEEQRRYFVVELATGDGRLVTYAGELPLARGDDLVDSRVRVRGICFTQFNRQRQLFDLGLLIPRIEDIVIETPAPADPFSRPAQPIGSLLRYSARTPPGTRLKVIGSVTLRYGDRLFIQDEAEGVCVATRQTTRLQVGDRVEVLGFPAKGEYAPRLEDGLYRQLHAGPAPPAARISADAALRGDYDCRLVTVEAMLLDRAQHSEEPFLVLQSGGFVFHAYLHAGEQSPITKLPNGSRVAVTGVCLIEAGEDWHYGEDWRAASFRILMRTPEDAVVLRAPSWWTLRKLLWATGILGAVVAAALAWVVFLRRRVRQQTRIIEEKLQAEGALKERYQQLFENASDLVFTHDLAGRITSVNSAGERLLQRPREVILSRTVLELIAEDQRPAARGWLEQVISGAEVPSAEWDFVNTSGQRVKLEINSRGIEQNGRLTEVEATGRDITERKRLEKEILQASSKEQQRIGHDLHDGVCQQLAAISYRTHILAQRLQARAVPESEEAEHIGDLINEALNQTRGVARGLFPVQLEENGLVSALDELTVNISRLFSVSCSFRSDAGEPEIDSSVALHVYYIAQEAVLNAARHSRASTIEVRLAPVEDRLSLTIRDNGCGFQTDDTVKRGMGIGIMRYRARVIGANLDLKTRVGQGTELACVFQPESHPARENT